MSVDIRPVESPTYSIVIPVYNEQESLVELRDRLLHVLAGLDGAAEVLLVDDGSTDASWEIITAMHGDDVRFKGMRLSRNFGKEAAMTAGIDMASGEAVVVMDADLQDPPEAILEMAARWRHGYDVVDGVAEDTGAGAFWRGSLASWLGRMPRRLSDIKVPPQVADFRLADRQVIDAIGAIREGNRYSRGLYSWVGHRRTGVTYRRDPRWAGASTLSLKRILRLAGDGVFSFSRVPLRVAMKFGVAAAILSSLAAVMALGLRLSGVYTVSGWTSILFAVCLLGSIQLVVLGVMGQYIGRTHQEVLARPLYVASELRGLGRPATVPPGAVLGGRSNSSSGVDVDLVLNGG